MVDQYWVAFADGPGADVVAHLGPVPLVEAVKLYKAKLAGLAPCEDCGAHPAVVYWVACLDHEPDSVEIESHARQVLDG